MVGGTAAEGVEGGVTLVEGGDELLVAADGTIGALAEAGDVGFPGDGSSTARVCRAGSWEP